MAQQVKFYSVGVGDEKPTSGNGIIFVDNGELYKGTQRFGANKVTTSETPPTSAQGAIGGDINIYNNVAKVFDGSEWKTLTAKTGWTASTYGGDTSFITTVSQAADGTVTAEAKNFNTAVKEAVGDGSASASSNGVIVSVTTTSGKVTSVSVTAPEAKTWTSVSEGGAGKYIQSIQQDTDGQVSATAVAFPSLDTGDSDGEVKLGSDAAKVSGWDDVKTDIKNLKSVVSYSGTGDSVVTATTGNFTNLSVSTANFSATTVSASTLTVNGTQVNNIAAKDASGDDKGVAVTVSTGNGGVTGVDVVVTSATLLQSLALSDFAGKTVVASAVGIANATNAVDTKIPTEAAVRKAIDDKVASLDNAMHYIGITETAAMAQGWTGTPTITGKTYTEKKAGDIVLKGTQEYIWNGSAWEIVGDQSAVTGGTSSSTVNGFTVTVATAAATAFPSVTLAAPEYNPAESSAAGTSNGHSVTVTTKNGQVTGVVVAAPSRFALSEIPDGASTSSAKGVQVSAATTQGSLTSVQVGVTLQSVIATTNSHDEIPSAKAVSDALCWYKSDGTTQW